MKIIVGLGNPGKEYEGTRHNIGREIVRALAEHWGLHWKTEKKLQAEITTKGTFVSTKVPFVVRLALPITYMNDSGKSVKSLVTSYKLLVTSLLIVHDDLDLPLGTLRFSQRSGAAGQKGVQSIIDALDTKDFARLRIGVAGAHRAATDAEDYVLKNFSQKEKTIAMEIKQRATEALADYCTHDLAVVMSHYNG